MIGHAKFTCSTHWVWDRDNRCFTSHASTFTRCCSCKMPLRGPCPASAVQVCLSEKDNCAWLLLLLVDDNSFEVAHCSAYCSATSFKCIAQTDTMLPISRCATVVERSFSVTGAHGLVGLAGARGEELHTSLQVTMLELLRNTHSPYTEFWIQQAYHKTLRCFQ